MNIIRKITHLSFIFKPSFQIQQTFFHRPKPERIMANNKPFNKPNVSLADTLTYPGLTSQDIVHYLRMVHQTQNSNYSSENIALLIYNFSKQGIITPYVFEKFYAMLKKFRGQFSMRSIYGFLYSAIKYQNQQYYRFFINQLESSSKFFTPDESVLLLQVLYDSKLLSHQEKLQFWQNYHRQNFIKFMQKGYVQHHPRKVFRLMDIFEKFQIYDQQIWNAFFRQFKYKKGWKRLQIFSKIYPYIDKFSSAQQLYDSIKQQIENNSQLKWRYNIQQRRLYTNIQMMNKCDQNVVLVPQIRSWFPVDKVESMNAKYKKLKQSGTLMQQAQIDQDKAKSLSYAIYNKYTIDKQSKYDISASDYEQMFGMTEQQARQYIRENEQQERQFEEQRQQQEDQEGQQGEQSEQGQQGEGGEQEKA